MMNKIGKIACWFLAYAASSVIFMMKFGNLSGLELRCGNYDSGFRVQVERSVWQLDIWILRGEV